MFPGKCYDFGVWLLASGVGFSHSGNAVSQALSDFGLADKFEYCLDLVFTTPGTYKP
jgi:hypothetical protein